MKLEEHLNSTSKEQEKKKTKIGDNDTREWLENFLACSDFKRMYPEERRIDVYLKEIQKWHGLLKTSVKNTNVKYELPEKYREVSRV